MGKKTYEQEYQEANDGSWEPGLEIKGPTSMLDVADMARQAEEPHEINLYAWLDPEQVEAIQPAEQAQPSQEGEQ